MKRKSVDIQIFSKSHEAWDAMYVAIESANASIYWEMYTFVDDEVGKRFVDLLIQKAQSGIQTKLMVDAMGSFSLSNKSVRHMRNAGVDVLIFSAHHVKRIRTRWKKLWARSHRKILVVDEHVGFIGGVNIQKSMAEWKDIHVRVEGKVVRSLLRSFAKNYIVSGGPKVNVLHLFKYTFRISKDIDDLEFIYDEPGIKKSNIRKKYVEALTKARERVILFSPYYFPDKHFLLALWSARKRGVRVDILIPFRSDIRIATYATYALFSLMHRHGVHVHMADGMMHGKGVIVDDEWAMIGSSNLDQTSFFDNYEANIRFFDKHIVFHLKSIVISWIDTSKQLIPEEWMKRGRVHRVQEWIAYRLHKAWYRSHERIEELKWKGKKAIRKFP